jgi:hypothetical protein
MQDPPPSLRGNADLHGRGCTWVVEPGADMTTPFCDTVVSVDGQAASAAVSCCPQ